jgi:hypothetical protein
MTFDICGWVADTGSMVRRHVAILFTLWAFYGVPTLCMAGVLRHACVPDQNCGPRDGHGHESGKSPNTGHGTALTHAPTDPLHDEGRNHKSDCVSDPCSDSGVRPDRARDDSAATPLFSVVLACILVSDTCTTNQVSLISTGVPEPRIQLPLHSSDLPRLI